MENSVFKTNVFKTLSVKPAKMGLRFVSQNTNRTNVMHAGLGLITEAGELLTGLTPYILGTSQLTEKLKVNAFEEMGDLGYYLMVLAKTLKIKLPVSSKKSRLKGTTRTAALLELLRLCNGIANMSKKVFYGPELVKGTRTKTVKTLNEAGEVTNTEDVQVAFDAVDAEKTAAMYASREAFIVEYMNQLIPLYWSLCFDMFDVPPSHVFVGNIAKLSKRYGEGFFQLSEAEARDVEEEMGAMTEAAEETA